MSWTHYGVAIINEKKETQMSGKFLGGGGGEEEECWWVLLELREP